ncbi:MAG: ISKra4 family transposase [Armatimonadetes bacterium]|nr:ISKra4 family transposase [Armatimonadota bacterium]
MSTEVIVSEIMELIQSQIAVCANESLSAKEERALAIGRRAAELVMSEMIAVDSAEPLCVVCECDGIAVSKESRSRSVVTMAGTHEVMRRRYRCECCGKWFVPRDKGLGIGSGNYSVGVVALASEVSAGFAFEAAEDFLARHFGLDLCYKQVQRLADRTGAVLCEREYDLALGVVTDEVSIVSIERPEVLTMSADGVMVHCNGAWTEMKCASFLSEESGRSTIATMEKSGKFGELMYLEAVRRGVRYAGRIVFVADGAQWIWNMVADHFPEAVEIVDWYHAVEHLWNVANAWYGKGSRKAENWVKKNKPRLMEDGADRVIASIKQWQPNAEDHIKIKRENLHYFSVNAHRMMYATFKLNGFCIGSGSVESACKQYGQGRLKGPGMRWKKPGIEAIAHLRSAVLNGRTHTIMEAAKIAA